MKIKTEEIFPTKENPFEKDRLNRKPCAEVLTQIVDAFGKDGCVLSIDGEWGSGKTTFIRMWEAMLGDEYKTIYFNAWESDYNEDPFISIISQLKDVSKDDKTFKKVASSLGRVGLSVGKSVVKDIVKKAVGVDVDKAVDAATEELEEIGEEEIKAYAAKTKAFEDFKKDLKVFVEESSGNHPIVFFVDELDRCNPTYAVRTLEIIKHLFDIPNIVFVLSINKEQLSYSIQGYFGSANMNANEYLKRFIDFEYSLPITDTSNYCDFLFDKYGIDRFFKERNVRGSKKENDNFLMTAKALFHYKQPNLRKIQKIFAFCTVGLREFSNSNIIPADVFLYFCYLKVCGSPIYENIRNRKYSYQQLLDVLENDIPRDILLKRNDYDQFYHSYHSYIVYLIAGTLYAYSWFNGYSQDNNFKGVKKDGTEKLEFPVKGKIIDKEELETSLTNITQSYNNTYECGVKYIFDKIELLNSLSIN